MEQTEHGVDAEKWTDGVIFAEGHEVYRSPGHDDAEIWNEIEDAGHERGEEGEVEAKAPEKEPARNNENESHHGSAHDVAAQNITDIVESVADFGAFA